LKGGKKTENAGHRYVFIWLMAALLLVLSGIAYRVLASRLQLVLNTPVRLPVSLSVFPWEIGKWEGMERPIPLTTKEYMEKNFADEYLSRRYISKDSKAWADLYIVYCSSRPGGILGHQPRVCYPGSGWVHDGTEESQFTCASGRQIPCLVHRFHKPARAYEQTVILNFYILNGQITTDESDFSSPFGRRPNVEGDPARYVAQVQISSVVENSIRSAAEDMAGLILDFLPDKDGTVRATELYETSEDVLE